MKYFKLGHGKWRCTKQFKNKFYFGPEGLILCNSRGMPIAGLLSNGNLF